MRYDLPEIGGYVYKRGGDGKVHAIRVDEITIDKDGICIQHFVRNDEGAGPDVSYILNKHVFLKEEDVPLLINARTPATLVVG